MNGVQNRATLVSTVSSQSLCLLSDTGHIASVSGDVREVGEDVGVSSMDTCVQSTSSYLMEGGREGGRKGEGEREGRREGGEGGAEGER